MIAGRAGRFRRKQEKKRDSVKQPDDRIPEWIRCVVDEQTQLFLRKQFYSKAEKGLLDNKAVARLLRESGLNPTDFRCHDLITEFDTDGDGVLSFAEYINMFTHMKREEKSVSNTMSLFKQGFSFMDKDENNVLDVHELREVMQEIGDNLSDAEFWEFFKLIDTENKGEVSWEAFHSFFEEERRAFNSYYKNECQRLLREEEIEKQEREGNNVEAI
eukprot:CAMPEP_0118924230 /NCGR_PEP_ID=MMETSP1169-20130426/2459_1 /TAXON_ID=36882 /ORGANISM="Pyramimonas obovata, Strain CCMP722" /LENGTH=215 /DNA_ID=CAMNT_0006865321 /DNA_START=545 /DNA_END=1189 /DNA_ORIENTATION=+